MAHRLVYRGLACGLAALLLVAPALAAGPGSEVVAKLGDTDVTVEQIQDFVRTLDPATRKQALADPETMIRLVRLELTRMVVLREAKAKNWEQRPEVAAAMQRARDQAVITSYLTSVDAPPADFPSDAEIQSAYNLNRDKFMVPRQYDLQQIYVALPPGGDKKAEAAAEKRADDLARKAKARYADFAALARANSDEKESAAKGGDLGWAPENQIMPEIVRQVSGMSNGDVSDPIRAADGWHIIRLVDTKPAAPRPLAEVHDAIVAALRQQKAEQNQQAYLAQLLQKIPVSVNEISLRKTFETAQ